MRRLTLAFAALLTLLGTAAQAQTLVLPAGQTARLTLAGPARDIIIGDPLIADVSVINKRTLVVMAKRTGVTSLSVFDDAGKTLVDRKVVVAPARDDAVTVSRGAATAAYACPNRCVRLDESGGPRGLDFNRP